MNEKINRKPEKISAHFGEGEPDIIDETIEDEEIEIVENIESVLGPKNLKLKKLQ